MLQKKINNILIILLLVYLLTVSGYRYLIFAFHPINLALAMIPVACWIIASLYGLSQIRMPRFAWAYLLFIGSWILAALFTTWIPGTLLEVILFGICLALFFAAINLDPDLRPAALMGILISGLIHNVISVIGIAQILVGSRSELYALNNVAALDNLIIILSLSVLLHTKSKHQKIWAWVGLISSLVVLWFTGSRAGIIAGLVAITVVLMISWLRDPGIFARPGLLAAADVLGSGLFGITSIARRSREASLVVQTASNSISDRVQIWMLSFDKILDLSRPFGLGPNTFTHYLWELKPDSFPIWIHAHNLGIQILIERGLVGLIAAGILLLIITATVLLLVDDPMLAAMGSAVLASTLLHGIWDLPWHEPYIMRTLIIMIGICLAAAVSNEPNHHIEN